MRLFVLSAYSIFAIQTLRIPVSVHHEANTLRLRAKPGFPLHEAPPQKNHPIIRLPRARRTRKQTMAALPSGFTGGEQDSKMKEMEEQIAMMMEQILTPEAKDRLARVSIVRKDLVQKLKMKVPGRGRGARGGGWGGSRRGPQLGIHVHTLALTARANVHGDAADRHGAIGGAEGARDRSHPVHHA